ncbi:MAG TPA: L-lysine 6-transaminase [Planctomycetota bacterium]|nr:L-lysine 6-transaminase [Planctomycetota bacterium]
MIEPSNVHEVLRRHQLADGMELVFDLHKSHGSWLVDGRTGAEHLDFYTCFASWPIGYNHPRMEEAAFRAELDLAAANNPANSDVYTVSMARFVEAFSTRATPPEFPYHFWVAGGALAVENAMKTAFDWKARKLGSSSYSEPRNDLVILHFQAAFHGRSGYTLSVTNTDPLKTAWFPKFDWPRVHTPAIEFDLDGGIANDVEAEERRSLSEIDAAFERYRGRIAGILIEPIQGEGGDNHFRPEFLARLRRIADERECLLVFDEVQTGFFGTGKPWMWQHAGVAPDVVAFGKKTQVCGLYASRRLDEVENHVFKRSGRINSTWGGNLVDMVRSRQMLDIILGEHLDANIARQGRALIEGLRQLARERGEFTNVRGIGSLVAFTLESAEARDAMLKRLSKNGVLALKSGPRAIRFRLPFVLTDAEVSQALERVAASSAARV